MAAQSFFAYTTFLDASPEGEARAAVSRFLSTYKPRYSAEERLQLAELVPEQEYQGWDSAAPAEE